MMNSSMTGKKHVDGEDGAPVLQPLDTIVTLNLTLNQFPTSKQSSKTDVKFTMGRDKFLQFSRDMAEALDLMENMKQI